MAVAAMSAWSRKMPGVYISRTNPRVKVQTYCECSRSNCMMKWAVYLDEQSVDSSFGWTRAEATQDANKLISQLEEAKS